MPRRFTLAAITIGLIVLAPVAARSQHAVPEWTWSGGRTIESIVRVTAQNAALRSGPDDAYKTVVTVAQGAPLPRVAPVAPVVENPSFFPVLVPGGYRAFVHKRYVDMNPDGHSGKINADHVNIRSQVSSSDYPIGQVDTGTAIVVIQATGENDEWLEIEGPTSLPLWVKRSDVEDLGALTPALQAEVEEARAARGTPSGAVERQENAERDQLARDGSELDRTAALVDGAKNKGSDVDFTESKQSLDAILAHATDPTVRSRAVSLQGRIVALEEMRRQEKARQEKAKADLEQQRRDAEKRNAAPTGTTATPGTPAEVGARVTYTGFLRVGPDNGAHPFALEQGTGRLAWLVCTSGRYALRDYAGQQVNVTGRVTAAEGLPVIETERIEIVTH